MNTPALRRLVFGLGITQLVSWATLIYSIAVLGAPMAADLGVSDTAVSGAFSVSLAVSGFAAPRVGRLIDRVGGRRVLPGVVYLEMACAAAAHASGVRAGSGRGVRLSQVVWVRPIVVQEAQPVQVHLALTERDDGGIDWEVCTRDGEAGEAGEASQAGEERLHSQGVVELIEQADPLLQGELVDLVALQAQCPQTLSMDEVYGRLQARGLHYGPAHRSIHSLHVGEQQALARLQLPAHEALPGHDLHPSMLDGALQACLGLSLELPEGATLLPYALERADVLAPCQARMWAHVWRSARGSGAPSV